MFFWINSKFKEQASVSDDKIIDLSNLTILLKEGKDWFWVGKHCGKIDGIVHIGNKKDIQPDEQEDILVKNEIQIEVNHKLIFENSVIYGIHFYNTKFHQDVVFQNTRFLEKLIFSGSIFYKSVDFTRVDISQHINENHAIIKIFRDA